jgi:hypothetical protein
LVSFFVEELHQVNLHGLASSHGALPAGEFFTAHDVATRLMYYERADLVSLPAADIPILKNEYILSESSLLWPIRSHLTSLV